MSSDQYHQKPLPQNIVKKEIVVKYFWSWTKIMVKRKQQLNYIDLYSGKGHFDTGMDSAEIEIVRYILKDEELIKKCRILFNDKEQKKHYSIRKQNKQLTKY